MQINLDNISAAIEKCLTGAAEDQEHLDVMTSLLFALVDMYGSAHETIDADAIRNLVEDIEESEADVLLVAYATYQALEKERFKQKAFHVMDLIVYKTRDGVMRARVAVGDRQANINVDELREVRDIMYDIQDTMLGAGPVLLDKQD